MSWWTHVDGLIKIDPDTRDDYVRYILSNLPKVTGSERDMKVFVVNSEDINIICVSGDFRDRRFKETLMEMNAFLNRLSKHLFVFDCFIRVRGYLELGEEYIYNNPDWVLDNFEDYDYYKREAYRDD